MFYEGKLQIDPGAEVIMPERGRGRRTLTNLTYLGAQNAETSDESGGSAETPALGVVLNQSAGPAASSMSKGMGIQLCVQMSC